MKYAAMGFVFSAIFAGIASFNYDKFKELLLNTAIFFKFLKSAPPSHLMMF